MIRFQETASWLLSSLGLALLVCSLVLVPTSAIMGQTGPDPEPRVCGGDIVCDPPAQNKCYWHQTFEFCAWSGAPGDICSKQTNQNQCKDCECKPAVVGDNPPVVYCRCE